MDIILNNNKNTSIKSIDEKEISQNMEKEIKVGNYLIKKNFRRRQFRKSQIRNIFT